MIDTSYEPFSLEPEYLHLNREFVESLSLSDCRDVLDLACGAGTLTELVLELAPRARVTGVDLDPRQLEIARGRLAERHGARVEFLRGTADELPLPDSCQDHVVMGNAIHLLPDLPRLLGEVRRVLRPGGAFSFSTSFWAGTFAPGTEAFYLQWMKEALLELRRASGGAVRKVRGTVPAANARPWMSVEEWSAALEAAGFRPVSSTRREVEMTQRSFETVGAYYGLAQVLLAGYPVEMASAALTASAGAALAASGRTTVPRLWLEMTGRLA